MVYTRRRGGITDAQVALAECWSTGAVGLPLSLRRKSCVSSPAAQGHSGGKFAMGAMYGGGHTCRSGRNCRRRVGFAPRRNEAMARRK